MKPAIALLLGLFATSVIGAERVELSEEARSAYEAGDFAAALDLALEELETCEALPPTADECMSLLLLTSEFAPLSGDAIGGEKLARRAVATARTHLGRHQDTATALSNLAYTLEDQARFAEAETLAMEALDMRRELFGEEHWSTAMSYNNLTFTLGSQGRFVEAEDMARRAVAIRKTVLGETHSYTAASMMNLAYIINIQGRYAEAEPWYREALQIDLETLGDSHPDVGNDYSNLGFNLRRQGRVDEAEKMQRRALDIWRSTLGDEHPLTAMGMGNLARTLIELDEVDEALALDREAVAVLEATRGSNHPSTGTSYGHLADSLTASDELELAETYFRKSLAVYRDVYSEHPYLAVPLDALATNLEAQGKNGEVEALFREALDVAKRTLNDGHPELALAQAKLAGYLARNAGDAEEALELARAAATTAVQRRENAIKQGYRYGSDGASQLQWVHAALLYATWRKSVQGAPSGGAGRPALIDEGYRAAQDLLESDAGRAMAQMAVRFASGDDPLAELIRLQQDTVRERSALDSSLLRAWGAGDTEKADNLSERIAALDATIGKLDDRLATEFPEFAALVAPAALDVETTQTLLGPRDALLLIPTDERQLGDSTFVFIVTSDRASWQRADVSVDDLSRRVGRLRCDLDPTTCTSGSGTSTEAARGLVGLETTSAVRGFDRSTAFELYRDLLAPLSGELDDIEHLYIVSNGALASLPLGVLVTEPPTGEDTDPTALQQTAWLADRFATTTLPSVSSLKSLQLIRERNRQAFLGFGDPALDGSVASGRGLAHYYLGVDETGRALADPDALRQLASLPGARAELETMAKVLGADESALRLGPDASETEVKSAVLKANVIAFATHGLVAGELAGIAEPGLVFTPPESASALDDGILTSSEAAQLDMDVDWLILSACNTASSDGRPGAQGLSGLAKGFLFAGAQSLLVSHWRVRDDVTSALTVEAIRRSDGSDKATGLQKSMIAIRNGRNENGDAIEGWEPSWSHPSAWAPFVLIGKNGRL